MSGSNPSGTAKIDFMEKVKAIKDESGHWYVIPNNMLNEFYIDEQNEDMINSGDFDNKWGKYRTGGDLNLVQLWAEIKHYINA
jgi:hypothetical protein